MGRPCKATTIAILVAFCLLAAGCRDPDVEAALADLTAKGSVKRLAAVETLRAAGWSDADVMRLTLRLVKWDEDTGLLADLLSKYPDAMLPPLLHRIVHSASVHRAQICRALGRKRAGNDAAVAVLLVRALFEPDEKARIMARLALKVASPRSMAILRAHDKLYKRLADGSTVYVSPGLVLGPDGGLASPYGRYVRQAMRAEGDRFGSDTVFRVLRFFAEIGEQEEHLEKIERALRIDDGAEARKAGPVLAYLGTSDLAHLKKLAARPAYLGGVARAVGILGPEAGPVVEDLFRAYQSALRHPVVSEGAEHDPRDSPARGEVWADYERYTPTADVLWAILRTGYKPQTVQEGLVDLLETDLVWIDRSMIEAALRCMRPNGETRERLIDLAVSFENMRPTPAVRSALRVAAWCEPPIGRLMAWIEQREEDRLRRPARLRLRSLRRQFEMLPEEKDRVRQGLLADLERWSEPEEAD